MSDHAEHARGPRRRPGARRLALALVVVLAVTSLASCRPAWAGARIDLRVLVFDDGNVNVALIRDELLVQGVPHDVVDLTAPGRTTVTPAFLSDDGAYGGKGHAYYQSIVMPTHRPAQMSAAELDVIEAFQKRYGVRRLAAFAWPGPESGAHWPATGPAYAGPLDGSTGQATAQFAPWLDGPIPFGTGTWGALAVPQSLPSAIFTPMVTVPIPGTGQQAPIVGQVIRDGVEELQVTVTGNAFQEHARLIAPAIVDYLTRGIHLGMWRSYLSVHIDDLFLPDDRWSIEGKCTPGEDCLPGPGGEPPVTTEPIRMVPADVTATMAWQDEHDFVFDMVYNAYGSVEALEQGPDPLTDSAIANRGEFRWINHTYRHDYLGCLKDLTVRPWRCETDGAGQMLWYSQAEIEAEIQQNQAWAVANDIPIDPAELVTGEHSGMVTNPQQPQDNPGFAPAVTSSGIAWLASDASREPSQRQVGSALTLPRYPMNIFYNVATRAEEIDEYNWIYTSEADGGSGICEIDPNSTCIAPLGPDGFESYIIPTELEIAMRHVLRNDPRPHFAHQSNLAEDRILLPVIEAILDRYRSLYADNAPIVSPTMTEAGAMMRDMTTWTEAGVGPDARVTAYRQGEQIVIEVQGAPVSVPLTVNDRSTAFGEAWGARRSAWTTVTQGNPVTVPIAPW